MATAPALTAAAVLAAIRAGTDAERKDILAALRAPSAEQAAASAAYVGKGHVCTVTDIGTYPVAGSATGETVQRRCERVGFRTAGRAAAHGTDNGGHTPA